MKKTFEEPELELVEIKEEDIVCASGCVTVCPLYGPPYYGTET